MSLTAIPRQTQGALAIVGGASIWGLFWIPLRYLSDAGFGPWWSPALLILGSLPIATLMALRFGRWDPANTRWIVFVGLGIGMAQILYFYAVVSTDVIRAIFLFYMLPIWTTLIDRVLLGIRLSVARSFSVILAFFGLWLLLGGDGGIPLPRNAGDWAGLASGFCWGATLSFVRGKPGVDAHWNVASSLFIGAALCVFAAGTIGEVAIVNVEVTPAIVLGAIVFGTVAMWPSMIGQLWGARLVPATRAALLTMSEIMVATISAWALIGTSLTSLSMIGGLVIIAAVLLDVLFAQAQED
jgi:drug/metabolite transporter (DMT)-like permease